MCRKTLMFWRFVIRYNLWVWIAALAMLVLAAFLLTSAVLIARTNSFLASGDAQFAAGNYPSRWEQLELWPYNWIIERSDSGEMLQFRKAALLLGDKKYEEAYELLVLLAQSDNPHLASSALTYLGKMIGRGGIEEKNAESLSRAIELTAAALVLERSNEDAKFNLELLWVFMQSQGLEFGSSGELIPGLPRPTLPGEESQDGAGESGPHSGY